MKKWLNNISIIDTHCTKCKYLDSLGHCIHPLVDYNFVDKFSDDNQPIIPKWCPLENAILDPNI